MLKFLKLARKEEVRVFNDLFFEQSVDVFASCYRHGICRSVFILLRSLVLSPKVLELQNEIRSKTRIAFTFFPNEYHAAKNAPPEKIKIDSILKINLHKMSFVRDQLGWHGLLFEFVTFAKLVVQNRGVNHLARMTHPFLGWLLYKSLSRVLLDRIDITVLTTNLAHPSSVGVTWACLLAGRNVEFLEHASTPRIGFIDRGYQRFYVNFEHTKEMFLENGVESSRVIVLHPLLKLLRVSGYASASIVNVGICINALDSITSVSLITNVVLKLGLKPIFRIHDADLRYKYFSGVANRLKINVSLARETRIEDFLKSVDLIVAGNSNVISDALLCAKPTVYFWIGQSNLYDYYGLIKYFSIPAARNAEELEFQINDLVHKVNLEKG